MPGITYKSSRHPLCKNLIKSGVNQLETLQAHSTKILQLRNCSHRTIRARKPGRATGAQHCRVPRTMNKLKRNSLRISRLSSLSKKMRKMRSKTNSIRILLNSKPRGAVPTVDHRGYQRMSSSIGCGSRPN